MLPTPPMSVSVLPCSSSARSSRRVDVGELAVEFADVAQMIPGGVFAFFGDVGLRAYPSQ